jgi:hypothetical protein
VEAQAVQAVQVLLVVQVVALEILVVEAQAQLDREVLEVQPL